jgi:hypothetical protein
MALFRAMLAFCGIAGILRRQSGEHFMRGVSKVSLWSESISVIFLIPLGQFFQYFPNRKVVY